MVQVHVTPQSTLSPAMTARRPGFRLVRRARWPRRLDEPVLLSCGTPAEGGSLSASPLRCDRGGGFLAVKKLIVVAALGLGAFAVWRKVQSDRAELDLWTEATAADED